MKTEKRKAEVGERIWINTALNGGGKRARNGETHTVQSIAWKDEGHVSVEGLDYNVLFCEYEVIIE